MKTHKKENGEMAATVRSILFAGLVLVMALASMASRGYAADGPKVESKPVVHNAEPKEESNIPADSSKKTETAAPILSPAEIEKYWIKEAKYQKLLAASLKAERERDEQTEVLKAACGKFAKLLLDQNTDKIFCQ